MDTPIKHRIYKTIIRPISRFLLWAVGPMLLYFPIAKILGEKAANLYFLFYVPMLLVGLAMLSIRAISTIKSKKQRQLCCTVFVWGFAAISALCGSCLPALLIFGIAAFTIHFLARGKRLALSHLESIGRREVLRLAAGQNRSSSNTSIDSAETPILLQG